MAMYSPASWSADSLAVMVALVFLTSRRAMVWSYAAVRRQELSDGCQRTHWRAAHSAQCSKEFQEIKGL